MVLLKDTSPRDEGRILIGNPFDSPSAQMNCWMTPPRLQLTNLRSQSTGMVRKLRIMENKYEDNNHSASVFKEDFLTPEHPIHQLRKSPNTSYHKNESKSFFSNPKTSDLICFETEETSFLPPLGTVLFNPGLDDRDFEPPIRSIRESGGGGEKNSSISPSSSVTLSLQNDFIIRSCELQPSVHQVEIPPAQDFLLHSRICSLMEDYEQMKNNARSEEEALNFSSLVGLTRLELESVYEESKNKFRTAGENDETISEKFPRENEKNSTLLKMLLQCADDLVVKGHFCASPAHEATLSENEALQVTIFCSQKHRQFIVCYQGSISKQIKPLAKGSPLKRSSSSSRPPKASKESILHPNQPVSVHPKFRRAYFANDIETNVFRLLKDQLSFSPFFDVVMTGHSFGGALATLGATRYASLFPMITVSCHAFGAPKVGGITFRHLSNSLPNLKVMRVEHGADPYVNLPGGKGEWMHVGHTITISSILALSTKGLNKGSVDKTQGKSLNSSNHSILTASTADGSKFSCGNMKMLAYRFDEKPRVKRSWGKRLFSPSKKKMQAKKDHEVKSYVKALERFAYLRCPWAEEFVGEKGLGISGVDDEIRCVV